MLPNPSQASVNEFLILFLYIETGRGGIISSVIFGEQIEKEKKKKEETKNVGLDIGCGNAGRLRKIKKLIAQPSNGKQRK